jgi:polar amino acid transport system substrate-binding protein
MPRITPLTHTAAQPMSRRLALHWVGAGVAVGLHTRTASAQEPMRFVYGDALPPHSYVEQGVLRGSLPRVMEELLNKRLRLPVVHQAYPWARAQALVQGGEADGFAGAATEERLRYVDVSSEWLAQARLSFFTPSQQAQLARYQNPRLVDDLAGLRIGIVRGNQWAQSVMHHREFVEVPDRISAFRLLLNERLDLLVDVSSPTKLALRAAGMDRSIQELAQPLAQEEVRVCVGKHSPLRAHLDDINQTLRSMRLDGTLARLFQA